VTQDRPLAGKRVLELGGYLAAPFAGNLLSQLGAEVIKLEPPLGDPTRTMVKGGPGGTFIAYSHGKRSLCLDLLSEGGKALLQRLLPTLDVVVHNLSPQATRKLGVDAASCHAANAGLVYCHIKGYGTGPREEEIASNPIIEAATGAMYANMVGGRPTRLGPSYQDMFAGMNAVIGILSAIIAGRDGPLVEVGLYETGLHVAARDLVAAESAKAGHGSHYGEFAHPGYGAYLTSDGRWIYLLLLSDAHWSKFCEMADLAEGSDSSLRTRAQRQGQGARVETAVQAAVGALTYDELARRMKSAGLGFTEVLEPEKVLSDIQAREPGKVTRVGYMGRAYRVAGFPLTKAEPQSKAPLLGEQSEEIARSLGFTQAECEAMLKSGALRSPLAPFGNQHLQGTTT
jgi:crotonobetainyl-CoA:carnitine CoA-transferase CaiB-like acyl-CoA transferase